MAVLFICKIDIRTV